MAAAVVAAVPAARLTRLQHIAAAADERTAGSIDDKHYSLGLVMLQQLEVPQTPHWLGWTLLLQYQASFLLAEPHWPDLASHLPHHCSELAMLTLHPR